MNKVGCFSRKKFFFYNIFLLKALLLMLLRNHIAIFDPTNPKKYAAMVEPNLKFLARELPCTASMCTARS